MTSAQQLDEQLLIERQRLVSALAMEKLSEAMALHGETKVIEFELEGVGALARARWRSCLPRVRG